MIVQVKKSIWLLIILSKTFTFFQIADVLVCVRAHTHTFFLNCETASDQKNALSLLYNLTIRTTSNVQVYMYIDIYIIYLWKEQSTYHAVLSALETGGLHGYSTDTQS